VLSRVIRGSPPPENARTKAELELWSLLVENDEETHFPIAAPDPIEAIRFRLDQAGLPTSDLLPCLRSKSRISEVMNGKRPLSLSMIRALHDGLKIPAAVLAHPSIAPEPRARPAVPRGQAQRRNHPVAA